MHDVSDFPSDPFTWRPVRDRGVTQAQLRHALALGAVVKLLRGVYARSGVELTPLVRAQAAALVISPHSVVVDRTASWVWGVECYRYAELDGTPPVETCVLRGHQATERSEVAGVTRDLLPEDWVDLDGLRVTTPLRTAMDLGCRLWPPYALGVMDALMREHHFSRSDLERLMRRYRGRRGVVRLRGLVPLADARAESQPESAVRYIIVSSGLAEPVIQVWVTVEGADYRLDLAYPRAKVAVEYDGEEFHTSPEQVRHDKARRAAMRRAGWIVIVVTKADLAMTSDQQWLVRLGEALRERGVRP
ncbi:MAG: hypothetical protein ACRDO4_01610 [Nocardioides sp.]